MRNVCPSATHRCRAPPRHRAGFSLAHRAARGCRLPLRLTGLLVKLFDGFSICAVRSPLLCAGLLLAGLLLALAGGMRRSRRWRGVGLAVAAALGVASVPPAQQQDGTDLRTRGAQTDPVARHPCQTSRWLRSVRWESPTCSPGGRRCLGRCGCLAGSATSNATRPGWSRFAT